MRAVPLLRLETAERCESRSTSPVEHESIIPALLLVAGPTGAKSEFDWYFSRKRRSCSRLMEFCDANDATLAPPGGVARSAPSSAQLVVLSVREVLLLLIIKTSAPGVFCRGLGGAVPITGGLFSSITVSSEAVVSVEENPTLCVELAEFERGFGSAGVPIRLVKRRDRMRSFFSCGCSMAIRGLSSLRRRSTIMIRVEVLLGSAAALVPSLPDCDDIDSPLRTLLTWLYAVKSGPRLDESSEYRASSSARSRRRSARRWWYTSIIVVGTPMPFCSVSTTAFS